MGNSKQQVFNIGFIIVCRYHDMEKIKSIEESLIPSPEVEPALPEYEKEVREIIDDENIAKTVAKAIRHYKTKNGIHMRLQKE